MMVDETSLKQKQFSVPADSLHVIEDDTDAFKETVSCQETASAIIGKRMEEPWVCLGGFKNFDGADLYIEG